MILLRYLPAATIVRVESLIANYIPLKLAKYMLQSELFRRLWAHSDRSPFKVLRKLFALKVARFGHGFLMLRLSNGTLLRVNPTTDKSLSRSFLVEGNYEAGFVRSLERLLGQGQVFIDVGANVGHISVAAAKIVGASGKVIAIEPNPETAGILRNTMKLNGCNNVTVLERAVARKAGAMDLFLFPLVLGGVRLTSTDDPQYISDLIHKTQNLTMVSVDADHFGEARYDPYDARDVRFVKVQCGPLDAIIENLNIAVVNVIKIDVEGFEFEVIKSAEKILHGSNPPIVVAEYSKLVQFEGGKPEEMLEYFFGMSWFVYKLEGSKHLGGEFMRINSVEEAPEHDNLFFVPPAKVGLFERSK